LARNNATSITRKTLGIAAGIVILAGSMTVAKRVIDPYETVTSVIDGDTFTISNRQTIRLFNVDAPELTYCYGNEAKIALEKMILGKKVIIKKPRTDFYKRVQGYVYVDGKLVNEYMAINGYGFDHGDGSPESNIIKDAANFAKEQKIGIFSEVCMPTKPKNPKCTIKANVDYNTKIKLYRLPGCHDYAQTQVEKFRGEDWFCTELEAQKAGFTKAQTCK
jgi:micrococcal nuclease